MPTGGTITALSTPWGAGSRAVIRVSGPDAQAAIHALDPDIPITRGLHHAALRLNDHTVPALVCWFDAPRSYTGEPSAEILIVSNETIIERVLDALTKVPDVRRAEPGEFSARAYLNDRLTLSQAEGIALRIAAAGDEALAAAAELTRGDHAIRAHQWTDELASLLALVEAGVDFTDQEDVVAIAPRDLARRLTSLRDNIAKELGSSGRARSSNPECVLVGAPNAGKSALFNALLKHDRALVSDQAGTTRDALSEPLDLEHDAPGAGAVTLTDLAGLADAAIDDIDAAAQRLARERTERADAILWCDPSGRFDPRSIQIPDKPTLRVRTKSDLPAPLDDDHNAVRVCAIDGSDLATLKRAIADTLGVREGLGVAAYIPRYRRAMSQALEHADNALAVTDPSARSLLEPELAASALRAALDALSELGNNVTTEDVLGRVFASFCVGK